MKLVKSAGYLYMKRCHQKILFLIIIGVLWAYSPSALAVNVTSVVLPNGGECLTVGQNYTIEFSYSGADVEHVALYYRTDGAQPTHLDSSVIKHPINVPQQGTTYVWKPTTSHISETGRIWVDGHGNGHNSLSTWDQSDANVAVRSSCAAAAEPTAAPAGIKALPQVPQPPAGFQTPAKAADVIPAPFSGRIRFESPWQRGEYRIRLVEELNDQSFQIASKDIAVNPGDIIEFPDVKLSPNTFYQNKKYIYAYDFESSAESVRSEVMRPFWTLPENPKQLEADKITATSVALTLRDEVPHLGQGLTGVLFEEVNSQYSSDWIAARTWKVAGLEPNTPYQFWVKLRSGGGNETPSRALATFRTKALPLSLPSPEEVRARIKEDQDRLETSQAQEVKELEDKIKKITKVIAGYQELASLREQTIKQAAQEEVEEVVEEPSLPASAASILQPPLPEIPEKKIAAEEPIRETLRPPQKFVVTFDGKEFNPAFLEVQEKDIVEWRNEASQPVWPAVDPHPTHTGLLGFDSQGFLLTGEFYRFTFRRSGTWPYHDHRSVEQGEKAVTGSVVVQARPVPVSPVIVEEKIAPAPAPPPAVARKIKKPVEKFPPVLPMLSEELRKIEKEALAPLTSPVPLPPPPPPPPPAPIPPRLAKKFVILFDEGKFKPQVLEIQTGDEVLWINQTDRPVWPASDPHPTHTGLFGFDALGDLVRGETYEHTFKKDGSWLYHNHTVARVGDVPESGIIIVKPY